jgi:hypothetical protein
MGDVGVGGESGGFWAKVRGWGGVVDVGQAARMGQH